MSSYDGLVRKGNLILSELEQILFGDAYAAPPPRILEGLVDGQFKEGLTHQKPPGAPHSIYEELWHICFWQQISLEWIAGLETPFPATPAAGFPTVLDIEKEPWWQLTERFETGAREACAITRNEVQMNQSIRCPSRPGHPARVMTVREQLENLGAHNAYHLGRIVLLRQLLGAWPPKSGGFSW